MSWLDRTTAKNARRLAKYFGHDMSRLSTGHQSSIAHCKNYGCHVMIEILDRNNWHFIDLGESSLPQPRRCDGRTD